MTRERLFSLFFLKYAFFTCCLTSSEPSKAKTKASTSFFCSKHDETASSVLLRKIKLINFLLSSFSLFVKILKFPSGTKTSSFLAVSPLPKCSKKSSSPFSSPFSFLVSGEVASFSSLFASSNNDSLPVSDRRFKTSQSDLLFSLTVSPSNLS